MSSKPVSSGRQTADTPLCAQVFVSRSRATSEQRFGIAIGASVTTVATNADDQPETVTIGTFRKWVGDEREVPIHPALLRQWEHINRLAHERVTTDPPPRPEPEAGTTEEER